MRANTYIIQGKRHQETRRLNRAWDKFNAYRMLIHEIHKIFLSIKNKCENEECQQDILEIRVFEDSVKMSRYKWKCPMCSNANNTIIKDFTNPAVYVTTNKSSAIAFILSQNNITIESECFNIFRLYSLIHYGSITNCIKKLSLDLRVEEKIPDNWQEIILEGQYNILPATTIANIVNKPVKMIRELRKKERERPKY